MTLTVALLVWDLACYAEHAGRVAGAVVQAVVDRNLSVSGEVRRLYWAARSCAATAGAEVGTFKKYNSEGKAHMRERDPIEAEWEEDGRLTRRVSASPVSPRHSAPLRSERGKRRGRVSMPIPAEIIT